MKSTVATSAVSKRWRSLWKSCLTKLHFHIPNDHHEWNSFRASVEALLLSICSNNEYSDEDLVLLSLSTNGLIAPYMFDLLGRIFTHGVANRVRTFRLEIGLHGSFSPVPPGLIALCTLTAMCGSVETMELSIYGDLQKLRASNFRALQTLRLRNCIVFPWTTDFLERAGENEYKVMYEKCSNLTKLELVGCQFRCELPVVISGGENLVEIVMVWPTKPGSRFSCRMLSIRAPRVKSLTCKEMKANWLQIFRLPSLECLDVDAYGYFEDEKDEVNTSRKFFHHLRGFPRLRLVKLHPRTVEVLTVTPGLLELENSPFENMECVEFHNCGGLISTRRVFNALISYFFNVCIRGKTDLFDRILAQLGNSFFFFTFRSVFIVMV
ncbi:hypothetical protein LINGRAHAP2_LOCUS3545 [Linum grandiflorum]